MFCAHNFNKMLIKILSLQKHLAFFKDFIDKQVQSMLAYKNLITYNLASNQVYFYNLSTLLDLFMRNRFII